MNKDSKQKDKFKDSQFTKIFPSILISILLSFYFSFFIVGYFAPAFFPGYFTQHVLISTFPTTYLIPKAIIFIIGFPLLIISYLLTMFTKPSEIPDVYPWAIKSFQSITNPQEKIEALSLEMINREEALLNNYNKLPKLLNHNPINHQSDTNSTSINIYDNSLASSYTMNINGISNDDYYTINERTDKGELRYCHTCKKFKPDRSHHCKICNKCYLKMDHHCYWMNNCICFANYKYFLTTLLYADIVAALFIWCLYDIIKSEIAIKTTSSLRMTALIGLMIVTGVFCILIFMLLFYHLNITLSNYSTFEHVQVEKEYEKRKSNRKIKYNQIDPNISSKMEESIFSMYDIGKWNNWIQVFGKNPLLWVLPIKSECNEEGYDDGFNFKTNKRKNEIEVIRSI